MKVGFVFTNFNNSKVTQDAIHSINLNDSSHEFQIVVVDNNSDQANIELLNNQLI